MKSDYIALASGHIFSNKTKRVLKPSDNGKGYQHVVLRIGNRSIDTYVHRFIAEALIPNINNLPEVNHINGDKTDNSVENLEWVSSSTNKLREFETGRKKEKPVGCYSEDGHLITIFKSVTAAAETVGGSASHIRNVCNSYKPLAYGYCWGYL